MENISSKIGLGNITDDMRNIKKKTLVLLGGFLVVSSVLVFFVLSLVIRNSEESAGDMQLSQVESVLNENSNREKELVLDLKKEYQIRAKSVAYVLDHNSSIGKDINELELLAEMMNIDEIHLFDTTGTIKFGTEPRYYGYSFNSGVQMGYFKPMLKDRNLTMCQDIMPNTADGKDMMYAIVWNKSGSMMIEVGIEPTRLLNEMKTNKISTVIANMTDAEGVCIYVCDTKCGLISASTDTQVNDKSIDILGLKLSDQPHCGYASIRGRYSYYTYKNIGEYVVMVTSVNHGGRTTSIVSVLIVLAYILFMGCIVLYMVRKLIAAENERQKYMVSLADLNEELKDEQAQLEEATIDQEAHIERITSLNKELEMAREAAEVANDAKTSFLFNMSHDIRTPMNAIIGFRDLLEKYQDDPLRRADYLNKIKQSSNLLLSIINDVLEMARIEKGTLEVEETAWSAEQFNDTLFSIFDSMMEQKGIRFTRTINVQHNYVFCDSNKLREIFINILSNAYKYTNSGGSVTMNLEEVASDREGYALYRTTISDTGIGMSEEFLPHIFEEFSRERNTTANKIEGSGLGMPIVKRLVEVLDGTIEVASQKGKGSTFIVSLPHRIADRSNLVSHEGVEFDPRLFDGKRILLAEDNSLNAEIAMEILSDAGFLVDHASDGAECLRMLKESSDGYYDVILMDIQMPNLNGYDTTRAIRDLTDAAKSHIPILAMTANAFEEDKREALRSGMNGHLAKPVNVGDLMKQLAIMLG